MVFLARDRYKAWWWNLHGNGYGLARLEDTVPVSRRCTEETIFAMQGWVLHTLSIVRLRGGGRRAKGGRTQLCYCGLPSSNVVVLREVFEGPAAQWTLMCFFLESSSLLWAAGHAGRSRGAIWAIGVFVEALLGMVNFRGCWQAGGRLDSLLKGSWEAQVDGMCRPWPVRTRKQRTRRRMRVGRTAAAARGSARQPPGGVVVGRAQAA